MRRWIRKCCATRFVDVDEMTDDTSRFLPPTDVLANILARLAEAVKACLVSLVVSVGKVKTRDIQSGIDQSLKRWDVPACRPECSKDLGGAVGGIALVEDHVEGDVSSAKFRSRSHDDSC